MENIYKSDMACLNTLEYSLEFRFNIETLIDFLFQLKLVILVYIEILIYNNIKGRRQGVCVNEKSVLVLDSSLCPSINHKNM